MLLCKKWILIWFCLLTIDKVWFGIGVSCNYLRISFNSSVTGICWILFLWKKRFFWGFWLFRIARVWSSITVIVMLWPVLIVFLAITVIFSEVMWLITSTSRLFSCIIICWFIFSFYRWGFFECDLDFIDLGWLKRRNIRN